MKEKHFYFYKDWFVFPLSVTYHSKCMEIYPPCKRLEIHFLWWHWKKTFYKKEYEEE